MEGQHPLTIVLLAVIGALTLYAGYQVVRVAWGIAHSLRSSSASFDAKGFVAALTALEREVAALSAPQARAEAERLLTDSPHLKVYAARGDADPASRRLAALAPLQREVLSRYERAGVVGGEKYVAANEVEPYEYDAAYVRLGPASTDGHVDVVTRPGEETIYELANDEMGPERVQLTTPSIYHWLVYLHREAELQEQYSRTTSQPTAPT
jgi:xanthosine utilization system XapX-like protein